MRIALLTATWKRWDLARRCMAHHRQLQIDGPAYNLPEIELFAVGSEGDASRQVCERYGYRYVEYPNDALWKKWNAVSELAGDGFDAYIILGADDIVTAAYLRIAAVMIQSGMHFCQPSRCVFYDAVSLRASMLDGFDGGAGRIISGPLYKRLQGKLWIQNALSSMDHYQRLHINLHTTKHERCSLPVALDTPWQLVDIKSSGGMWPWSEFDPHRNPGCREINAKSYIEFYFPTFEWHRIQ